ncbi:hypothetical protein AAF712_004726 [Marasmius tenuissimus]|uniref:Transmembrane protein n=1 Tax=Marasmius tenuissimus TaxID=585030 RepID=A0ABR3A4T0_9AGAR
MPSFRSISLFFVAALATFTAAAPAYTPPTGVYEGGKPGCDATCMVKAHPLVDIMADVKVGADVFVKAITALSEVKPETIKAPCDALVTVIAGATAEVKAYIDAKVDVSLVLGPSVKGGAAVNVDIIVNLFLDIIAALVVCIKAAIQLVAQVDLAICVQIFATVLVAMSLFIQVCVQLVVGIAVKLALAVQIKDLLALLVQLNLNVSLLACLGIKL